MICRYWKDQPDGFNGDCTHPENTGRMPCILNGEDACDLMEVERK